MTLTHDAATRNGGSGLRQLDIVIIRLVGGMTDFT